MEFSLTSKAIATMVGSAICLTTVGAGSHAAYKGLQSYVLKDLRQSAGKPDGREPRMV